jgi:hypothetical protein
MGFGGVHDPKTWIGKDIRIVTEWLSMGDMATIASRVSGKTIVPMELDEAGFQATENGPWPRAKEVYLIMSYFVNVCPQ